MNLNDKNIDSQDKIYFFKEAKNQVIDYSKEKDISKLDSFLYFKNKIIQKYNNYKIDQYHIKFIKKIFNIKNKKNEENVVDNLFFDGISKEQCLRVKKSFFKLLDLISPHYTLNIPPLDICLYLSKDKASYALKDKNMIVITFSDFDEEFVVKQLLHEYIHFIEFYNSEFAIKNLNFVMEKSFNKKRNCNINGEYFEIYDLDDTYDEWSGYVYPDNHTEIVSTEIMYLLSDPIDALFTKSDLFQYLNENKFFNN